MKSRNFLPVVIIILVLPVLFGCPSKNEPTPSGTDQQLTKLSKTWKATSAKLDGVDQTGYTNFTIKLSGTAGQTTFNYTSGANTRPALSPWNSAGSLTFGTDFATQLTRDDSLPVTYSVTDTQLEMSFNYNGAGFAGPRISNVKGNWVFKFTAQ